MGFSRLTIIAVVFWVVVILIQDLNWYDGIYRAILLVLVLLTTPVLIKLLRQPHQLAPRRVSVVLACVCTILLCWHFVRFAQKLPDPKLDDIATTTLSAVDAIQSGKNPYSLPIDPQVNIGSNPIRYQGYKYLPMMAVTYLPLGAIWRERGILVTNLILDLATVVLVFQLCSTIGSRSAGLFAVVLYLMLPLVPIEIFKKGVTDLAATVPLLTALCLKNPGYSGLFVGLSVSTKLLPGAVFIPCCLPSSGRGWYAAGVAIGLVPTLVFLALSPEALSDNIVLFNAKRPVDSTSWLYGMPPQLLLITTAVVAVALLGVTVYFWLNRPALADRCGIAVVCTIGTMLSGPINHRNYQLWWLPLFIVLLGAAAFQYPTQRKV